MSEKKFNPFDECWLENKSALVGILEGCVDYLTDISEHREKLSRSILKDNENLKYDDLSLYIAKLMTRFLFASKKKNCDDKIIFDLIKKDSEILFDILLDDKSLLTTEEEDVYRYTLEYFIKKEYTTKLKFCREKSGKTQKEMAEIAGVSLRQYQRYEAIDSTLNLAKQSVIEKITKALNVKPEELVYGGYVIMKQTNLSKYDYYESAKELRDADWQEESLEDLKEDVFLSEYIESICCEAGLSAEWDFATEDNYKDIILKAAELCGVEVVKEYAGMKWGELTSIEQERFLIKATVWYMDDGGFELTSLYAAEDNEECTVDLTSEFSVAGCIKKNNDGSPYIFIKDNAIIYNPKFV